MKIKDFLLKFVMGSVLICIIFFGSFIAWANYKNNSLEFEDHKAKMFDEYKDELQIVVDKMLHPDASKYYAGKYSYYEDSRDDTYSHYTVELNSNRIDLPLMEVDSKVIPLTEEEENASVKALKAFSGAEDWPNRIDVYKDRVIFVSEGNHYALAYIKEGFKPDFMRPGKDSNLKIEKINKYWYHIFKT